MEEFRCGPSHGVGMQKQIWIHFVGRLSGLGDRSEIDGKEKQESGEC